MAHFNAHGRIYRDGADLPSFGSVDVTITAPGTTVEQNAAPALPFPDGSIKQFLYWDTGRRITNKRRVRWTFNHPGNWSEWAAVAWYGTPPTGPGGQPAIAVDAHWVTVGPIDPTPIDQAGSTFANPAQFPFGGNDHLVNPALGACTLRAKDHLQRHAGDPMLDFSAWQKLIFGGESTGFFEENDDDITAGSGITGIVNSTSQLFSVGANQSAVLMAAYVTPVPTKVDFFGRLFELIREAEIGKILHPNVDDSPEDIVRLKLIAKTLEVMSGRRATEADAFEGLVDAARKMNQAQLKRTIAGTKATLLRGQSALKSLEALAKTRKPGR